MHPYIAVPAVSLLVLRAWSNKSLTPLGIFTALITAIIHAIHPWSVFFALLVVFFLGGTAVTKVKKAQKAKLTQSASGEGGGEGPRTHVQVLANSLVASVLIAWHWWIMREEGLIGTNRNGRSREACIPWGKEIGSNVLVAGIIGQYAAVAADTFSSELGILAKSPPRLITSPTLRVVPPGTNGGVTMTGLLAGLGGAATIAVTAVLLTPFCRTGQPRSPGLGLSTHESGLQGGSGWGIPELSIFVVVVSFWGLLGSLLDSFLGGWLQNTVIDAKTGKVVEGHGGVDVSIEASSSKPSDGTPARKVVSGAGILDNNMVNLAMAATMGSGAVLAIRLLWSPT